MRPIWILAAATALIGVSLTAAGRDVPINLWFDNTFGLGLTSDGSTAGANGVVADYIDGLQNVLAVIQSSGTFRFSTQDNTHQPAQRLLCIDFGNQYPGPLPFGNGGSFQCVNMLQAMHDYGASTVGIAGLHPGQSVQKLVRFTWDDAGYYYRLGYGSDMNKNGVPDSPPVTVSCVEPQSQPTAACTKWMLTPLPDPSGNYESSSSSTATGTAAFYRAKILKNGGEDPAELLGYYVMAFTQTFTRK